MTLTRTLGRVLTLLPAILPLAQNLAHAQAAPATIASKATGFERRDGFIPVYVDAKSGKLLLELPKDSTRALLMVSQATGFGSNPIGIDRGASGGSDVVRFDREGERVLVVFEKWRYRSSAANKDHQRTISENFPTSIVAALPLMAEEQGRLLVDRAHWGSLARDIDRWLERGEVPPMSPALVAPPGDPFGIPN